MKRQRQSWATRELPPVTVEEIERHLDFVAVIMSKAGNKAHLLVPIWNKLIQERDARRGADSAIAEALARAARLANPFGSPAN